MTSDEIKAYEIAGTEKGDPRLSRAYVTQVECNMMLKEIAYQLAVMNERNVIKDPGIFANQRDIQNRFLDSVSPFKPDLGKHQCISNDGDKCKICGRCLLSVGEGLN